MSQKSSNFCGECLRMFCIASIWNRANWDSVAHVTTGLPWTVQTKTVSDTTKVCEKTTQLGMELGETPNMIRVGDD